MKYIDADLLRKEIERLNNLNKQIAKEQGSTDFIKGITAGYAEVLSSINSLQQEQSELPKIARIRQEIKQLRREVDDHNYYLDNSEQAVGYANALLDIENFLDTLSEEPDKSLEEEIRRYLREECSGEDEPLVSEIARHFAEWQKSQMLKDAKDGYVSAIIIHDDGDEEHYAVTYPNGERPHSITDKVKIIIL